MTNGDYSTNEGSIATPGQNVREVGLAQRLLLWAVLASFAVVITPYSMFVTVPFQLYCVYKLAKALKFSTGAEIVWLVAMFIPLVSLICLLILNGRATRALKDAGIRVGLMGARVADLPAT